MAGRPTTKNTETKTEIIKQSQPIVQTQSPGNENELLKKRLADMEAMMQALMSQLQAQPSKTVEPTQNEIIEDDSEEVLKEIPMSKPIKVMSLFDGTLNLKTSSDGTATVFKFNFFGDVKPIIYSDLIKVISHDFRFFDEGFCVILDKDVVKQHYFEDKYKSFLDKKTIENILDYDNDKIIQLYKSTVKQIQETIVDLVLDKLAKDEYVDHNKVRTLSDLCGKNLLETSQHLK